ncbi:hypothetical protein [Nostoc cycadae]|uniref:Glucose-inhibited division protein A n=1 Tax=Nostoc cycadae WK-1 TaxID=1861711 RepID=A0A2H6LN32_9NOSO|nr:hypothetical protein [Nostoc cycadae]GBE94630.1 glucose-inhibited division protein A [Nostoc cycadae WK-1]
MNRSKIVAIVTGAISILLAIAYLIIVQILDYRDMQPAPISQINSTPLVMTDTTQYISVDKMLSWVE